MAHGTEVDVIARIAALRDAGAIDEAVEVGLAALARAPARTAPIAEAVAACEMRRGRWGAAASAWEAALEALRGATGAEPRRTGARFALNAGTCRFLDGEAAAAAANLLTAFVLDRRVRKSREYILLAARLTRRRAPERAARLLERGLARHPDDHAMTFDIVALLLDLDRPVDARPFALRLLAMRPDDAPGLDLVARVAERCGDRGDAWMLRRMVEASAAPAAVAS